MTFIPTIQNKISAANSTTTLLGAAGTWIGSWENVVSFTTIAVAIFGSLATDGTLYIESSQDGGVVVNSVPFTVLDISFDLPHIWNIVESDIRIRYVNGTTPQSGVFQLQTKYSVNQQLGLLQSAGDLINSDTALQITKSVLTGISNAGDFHNVTASSLGELFTSIRDPLSAFGDLRTVPLSSQVHVSFEYNINSELVNSSELNGATITQDSSMALVSSNTASNGSAIMSTRRPLKYRSGLGALCRYTAKFTIGGANSIQIAGIGNSEDGLFFGYDGIDFGILRRSNSVDTWTVQTAWNGDTMDGSGNAANPSHMNLVYTNINVFEISFQWLGAGALNFFIEDSNTGAFQIVHNIKYANLFTSPSFFNPTLEGHFESTNTGNLTNLIVSTASFGAFVEGDNIQLGFQQVTSQDFTASTDNFHIRNNLLFSTKTNRVIIYLRSMVVANDKNSLISVSIFRNATIPGAAFVDIDATTSPVSLSPSTATSAGTLVYVGAVSKDNSSQFNLVDSDIFLDPGDTFSIVYTSGGTGAATIVFTWLVDL